MDTFNKIWDNIYLRVLLIISLAFLFIKILIVTKLAWISFLIAFLIAYLVEPVVIRLENTRFFPRWLSITFTMIVIILFFIVGVILMGEVLAQLSVLPTALSPLLNEDVPSLVANLQAKSPPWLAKIFNENTTTVQQFFEEQRQLVVVWLQSQARGSIRTIRSFFTGASQAFLIIVMAGFLISSYASLEKSFITVFPKRNRSFVDDLLKKLDVTVGGYIRAKVVEAIIVGIVTFIAISFMGVPKAIGLSFIATVLNPVPYLGPFMATIPIVLSALTISWQKALITLFVMGLIQVLDGNILQPILLAQSVKVHPVTVLVALLIGASLLGVWGVLLAIPVAAFLQLIYTDYYLSSDWYKKK